jgi:hypothetical protein
VLAVADRQRGLFDAAWCSDLLPEDSIYSLLAEHGDRIVRDEDFADCYSERHGRPSIPPSLLAKVLLLAYRDGLSDERAMEAVRFDLRWKVALDLPVDHRALSALIAAGLALWARTLRLFMPIGKGMLASWDPTRHLVVEGPYSRVRSPMITGVLAVLIDEAALFGSPALLIWCGLFLASTGLLSSARGTRARAPLRRRLPCLPTPMCPVGSRGAGPGTPAG